MAHEIFISLTHHDAPLADALRDALGELLGDAVAIRYSTSKELEGGIRHGEDWFQWIVKRVQECDFALILLTPASAQKPWVLWEAGAVYGAALASGAEGLRKIRPLVYQLSVDQIPSPIRDSKVQFLYGHQEKDMVAFCKEIVHQYQERLGYEKYGRARESLGTVVGDYLQRVVELLMVAPALATSAMLEEWRRRLDGLLAENRPSEVDYLRNWIDIAFGRENEEREHPLDVQLHLRLAEGYTKAQRHEDAIGQLKLAQRLAPRDIYVLRTLGKAYLDTGHTKQANEVITRIGSLDSQAFAHNPECAALKGRWERESKNPRAALNVYRAALEKNGDSHYLVNLAGEALIEAGDLAGAKQEFERVVEIVTRLRARNEDSRWTRASMANAKFFLDEDADARKELELIRATQPSVDALATIERGLETIAKGLKDPDGARLAALKKALRG